MLDIAGLLGITPWLEANELPDSTADEDTSAGEDMGLDAKVKGIGVGIGVGVGTGVGVGQEFVSPNGSRKLSKLIVT